MIKNIFLSTVIVFLVFLGCKKESSNVQSAALINTTWYLSYIRNNTTNDVKIFPGDELKKIIVVFTDSLNVVTFRGVCNDGLGNYTYSTDDNTIQITNLSTTLINCKNVEWEGYAIQNLNKAYSIELSGDNLHVLTNGDYSLHFSRNKF